MKSPTPRPLQPRFLENAAAAAARTAFTRLAERRTPRPLQLHFRETVSATAARAAFPTSRRDRSKYLDRLLLKIGKQLPFGKRLPLQWRVAWLQNPSVAAVAGQASLEGEQHDPKFFLSSPAAIYTYTRVCKRSCDQNRYTYIEIYSGIK